MNRTFKTALVAAMLFALLWTPSRAQESKLGALLERSPKVANSLTYMHLPSLRKLLFDAGIELQLSQNIDEVWAIADMELESLAPNWEAGYATIGGEPATIDSLVKATGGFLDEVSGKPVVWTPHQTYLVPMPTGGVGFLRPAKRPLAADWISSKSESTATQFMQSKAKSPEQFLSLLLAFDLHDALSAVTLTKSLSNFDVIGKDQAPAVAKQLASISGISIIVGRKSLSECILTVDFESSPASLLPNAKPLLNELLNRNGTAAPEVMTWAVKVDGNSLVFQGPIGADSLDALLGIYSIRNEAEQLESSLASSKSVDSASREATASKEYFDKVNKLIERVRKYDAQSTGYRAKWNDQQARRIGELGTLNVDPEMVAYGTSVATILRNNALAIRSGNVAAGQLQAAQAENWGIGYDGYYGGYYGNTPQSALRGAGVTGAQQRMAGFGSFQQAMSEIDKLTADTRVAMTKKYDMQF